MFLLQEMKKDTTPLTGLGAPLREVRQLRRGRFDHVRISKRRAENSQNQSGHAGLFQDARRTRSKRPRKNGGRGVKLGMEDKGLDAGDQEADAGTGQTGE